MTFHAQVLAGDAALVAALGESVSWTPRGGAASTITGLVDRDYVLVNGTEALRPVLRCLASDVPGAGQGDQVAYAGTAYQVTEVQPDDFGMVVLVLRER